MPLSQAVDLTNWLFVYEHPQAYDQAYNINECIKKCSKQLGIRVSDPSWVPVPKITNYETVEKEITKAIKSNGTPQIVFFLLPSDS
jgi:hypothetical protein